MDVLGYILGEIIQNFVDETESLSRLVCSYSDQHAFRVIIMFCDQFARARISLRIPIVNVDLMADQGSRLAREQGLDVPASHLGDADEQVCSLQSLSQISEISATDETRAVFSDCNSVLTCLD